MASKRKRATAKTSSRAKASSSKASASGKAKASTKAETPWERPAPKKAHHTKLTPAKKAAAKRRAKKAGRHYPNLVDNMYEAQKSK